VVVVGAVVSYGTVFSIVFYVFRFPGGDVAARFSYVDEGLFSGKLAVLANGVVNDIFAVCSSGVVGQVTVYSIARRDVTKV